MSEVITRSGVLLDLADPDPTDIFRADIAAGLSGACRFAAQTEVFYSVAQHAVMVSGLVEEFLSAEGNTGEPAGAVLLAALHHDSHEAFMGDLPAPLKLLLPGYEPIAARLDRAIHDAIGIRPGALDSRARATIHRADMVARCIEAEEVVPGGIELVLKSAGNVRAEDLEVGRSLWIEPLESGGSRELFAEREDMIHDLLLAQARQAPASDRDDGVAAQLGVKTLPLSWFSRSAPALPG